MKERQILQKSHKDLNKENKYASYTMMYSNFRSNETILVWKLPINSKLHQVHTKKM